MLAWTFSPLRCPFGPLASKLLGEMGGWIQAGVDAVTTSGRLNWDETWGCVSALTCLGQAVLVFFLAVWQVCFGGQRCCEVRHLCWQLV